MLFLLGVLLIAIGVGASIALHELGHLIPAKLFGVKVTQYMIGFGPTIWSRRKGETEIGLKAIPLGGYVRMIGMFPPRPEDEPGQLRLSSTGRVRQMSDQMRQEAYEPVDPADEDRVFYKLAAWKKVVIMFGGTFMNLVIAAVLIVFVACGLGLPKQTSTQVGNIQPCLATSVDTTGKPDCAGKPASPAERAGFKENDTLVSINGVKITTTEQAITQIRKYPDQQVPMVVRRTVNGTTVDKTLEVTPERHTVVKLDSNGQEVLDIWGKPVTESAGMIGAGIGGGTWVTHHASPAEAVGIVGHGLKQTAAVFVKIPQKMVGVFSAAFGSGKRDANGPISVVGVGRIAGDVAGAHQVSILDKAITMLMMLASLNLALFVFNLVPLLPLDGGHVAGAIWEAIKRGWYRARGLTGPVYADVSKALPLAYGVSMVLILMFGLLIYADIVNPVKLGN